MNFNSIRVRYTAAFGIIAIFFIVLVLMNFNLINKTQSGMNLFGQTFNPGISAILNADRDLYQARVAELQAISSEGNTEQINQNFADFKENAQQAFDRMQKYNQLLSVFPDVASSLSGFKASYDQWVVSSTEVFNLIKRGEIAQAKALSNGESNTLFEELRVFYNLAGEIADKKSAVIHQETLEVVDRGQFILTIVSIIVIILTVTLGIFAPKTMADALENLSAKLSALNTSDGDLTKRINSKRKDEIGDVANNFDNFIDGLAQLINSIVTQSNAVIDGVNKLNAGAQQIEGTSMQQTDSVDAIATAINEMSYAIKEVAQNANLTAEEVNKVNLLTTDGTEITGRAVKEIQGLSETVSKATEVILKLSENSTDIASVLDVIRSIAEQTNLLALNAAIEAARAGEQGRGFAVVADEVRTLAARTQQSTEDIQVMIETLQKGVKEAVTAINLGNEATQSSVDLSEKTLDAFAKIATASQNVIEASSQTATATEEQSQVAEDVSRNITELSDQTSSNYQMAKDNGSDATAILSLAQDLNNSVSRFKLN
ncbi:methyl-accepting chemotaxis protein [Thalassotalea profundi]|uniref:Chemotaxis transducer n=1 Tax=Thalassotalea profundi TaxID=2036687 RepID=A0ABQ3J1Q2_9GAMM|nr:methyl-accepting chemotaxis protein [Thalassotalea profundi]GHE96116.1 chemotaxis transducer [Thalassotalea profundi]